MITILLIGMLATAGTLGVLWGSYHWLSHSPKYQHRFNRESRRRLWKWTLILYFLGFVLTITWMVNASKGY